MAGVPVHTSSPISTTAPAKALGRTPSTAAARYAPAPSTATTTTAGPPTQSAQPGAPAVPRPTGVLSEQTNSAPAPTPTSTQPSTTQHSNPPPPQPGAVPIPSNVNHLRSISIPASPQPNTTPSPYTTTPLAPHQQNPDLITPNRAQPPASTTSTNFSSPFTSNTPNAHDLSHPPGYIQNSRASFEDRPFANYGENNTSTHLRRSSNGGAGILNGEMRTYNQPEEEKGVWDAAMSWAKTAGDKLSKTEAEIWKVVNGEK